MEEGGGRGWRERVEAEAEEAEDVEQDQFKACEEFKKDKFNCVGKV